MGTGNENLMKENLWGSPKPILSFPSFAEKAYQEN